MSNKIQQNQAGVSGPDTRDAAQNAGSIKADAANEDAANANADMAGMNEAKTDAAGVAAANVEEAIADDVNAHMANTGDTGPEQADAGESLQKELEKVKGELEEKSRKCAEYFDRLQRAAAEFDNFKKRTVKEKEMLYIDAVIDVVSAFLPAIDNVERAIKALSADEGTETQTLKEGVEMVYKQFKDALKSIGIEEIKALNEQFDPTLHNAVMHVEDEAYGRNTVIEEFQKGYIYKDRVIRHSMVKVAN